MSTLQYIDQMDVGGKRVLLRADLNVPLDGGRVADDSRILAVLPTIRYALERDCGLVIVSHLGRPGGRKVPALSLAPVSARLSDLLGAEVGFVPEVRGGTVEERAKALAPGSVIMLENLRFDPGEEENDEGLARALASYADVYIDDAFSTAHRAHASNVGVVHHIAARGGGLLMKRELTMLCRALDAPRRPLVAVIGGAKVKTKIGVLENLSRIADRILLGGMMSLPFLSAQGRYVGRGLDEEMVAEAGRILTGAGEGRFLLPADLVGGKNEDGSPRVVAPEEAGEASEVMDIGPAAMEQFISQVRSAGTMIWNGPLGVFEQAPYDRGTRAVAEAMAASSAFTLVGGGDTGAAIRRWGLDGRMSYVSTGGGAFLEMLAGKELPAVRALETAEAGTVSLSLASGPGRFLLGP
ncbi:MAG: phosphoglycerate kinase [Methanomassiliicoccus sp.]|nr:phosphoglycerate kinase [Methanomassiliicoccus sp.]